MAKVQIANFIFCVIATLVGADLHGQGFLAKSPKMQADSIRSEIAGVLMEVLGHGHGIEEVRLKRINATLLPIFRSLPKNNRGHVSEPIMRYAMRRYFSATHAWMVKGFADPGDSPSNASAAEEDIFRSKVPSFVRSALEHKFAHQGFALNDMVSMIAAVEHLIFNEVVRGVETSFHLNSLEADAILSESQLQDVLSSYLITEMLEGSNGIEQHTFEKQHINERYPNWANAAVFLQDISGSDGFGRHAISNPFKVKTFDFQDVMRMAGRISEEFGPWSSYECHDMKNLLSEKDVHEIGRVKLSDFYQISKDGAWQFLEPSEYLRQLGALDESSEYLGPQVIIPNYITGMSNCVTSAKYFATCCLNECDMIYEHIEDEIASPNGTVSQILEAVASLPFYPDITPKMASKLEDIATLDGGAIPLHGRLFAQWLHFTFPRDCPYPHVAGSISPKSQGQWRNEVGEEFESVTDDEVAQHNEHAAASREPSPDAGAGMWNFEEVTMDFSTPSDGDDASLAKMIRLCTQVALVGAFAALLLREGVRIYSASKGARKKEYSI